MSDVVQQPAREPLFRAKFIMIREAELLPVLVPAAASAELQLTRFKRVFAQGECELHVMGTGALGFCVTKLAFTRTDGALLNRGPGDAPAILARILDRHFLAS